MNLTGSNENILERYELCIERIRQISGEGELEGPLLSYFNRVSEFIDELSTILERAMNGGIKNVDEESLADENHKIYEDILGENYEKSFANPDFITRVFENDDMPDACNHARNLCFLYAEMRGLIPFAYEGNVKIFTIYIELYLEIYTMFRMSFEDGCIPTADSVKECIYWFESDNCDVVIPERLYRQFNPEYSFATDIIMNEDINNTRYLYLFGEYISEDELNTSRYINSLSEEDIKLMADTFTEGYRIGFVKADKPLDKKTSVNIRYSLGFERVTKKAIENFYKIGLAPDIHACATLSLDKKGLKKIGYVGGCPNRQYEFDHKDDEALYLDADFVTRKADVLRDTFEEMKLVANGHAGPACQEVFGEEPFEPVSKSNAIQYCDRTRKLSVDYSSRAADITNEYIIGEERSFTIIAYPTPAIGKDYEQIFRKTVELNTLDYRLYENMQQILIDTLDKAKYVRVVGKGKNRTNIRIALHKLNDPAKETNFENCVADVNIPVGEVFTSPVLEGTNGTLHVTGVYLNDLFYDDFELKITDGMIEKYSCSNYENEADNQKYIADNFLFNHKTLPMGEFAIGTNTVAYKMTRDFGIAAVLPILIGEKTGPHFAFGDTCYSHEEDIMSYNPDGKAIIARENEISAKRHTDVKKAYFQCHTDVTIPYDELGGIYAVTEDGEIPIFEDGIFALNGLEELNIPLKA